MRRVIPRSLIGQIALVMALVLLVLQIINFAAVRNERLRLNQAQLEEPVITRFVAATARLAERNRDRPMVNRRGRIEIGEGSAISAEANDPDLAVRLRESATA